MKKFKELTGATYVGSQDNIESKPSDQMDDHEIDGDSIEALMEENKSVNLVETSNERTMQSNSQMF